MPRPRRALLFLTLLALLAALGWGAWSWRHAARPGRVHAQRGEQAAAAGRFDEAAREWARGIREDPTDPECYELLGDLDRSVRDAPDAAANYAAAARLLPSDGPLFEKLSAAQSATGDERAALQSANQAFQLLPDDAGAAAAYAGLARHRNQWGEALAAQRRAHRLAPTNADYLRDLVSLEIDAFDYADAERDLQEYGHLTADDAWYWFDRALIETLGPHSAAHLRQALADARRSVAAPQPPLRASLLLGQLSLEAGRVQDALRTCQAVLRQRPDNAEALYQLVTCETRLHQPQRAAQAAAHLAAVTRRRVQAEHLQPPSPL